ncbi:MAG TPA: FAD/NAD(P)-binding protein [Candidatus Sulfotelmatobacter sp.]|nr:FAD/NAD(P)-binding protein [Candidatus Sulfotelmatobacter sp.]
MSDSNGSRDRELGMKRKITRRDFLNGVAVGLGATATAGWMPRLLAATQAEGSAQDRAGYYPPALTGMRGSHPGSFETAHSVRDGEYWNDAGKPVDTGEHYDLIVVGGGISGLAAAYFYRKHAGANKRILILDNHDDFGGHAKRNEFRPGGRLLLANGGTLAIESPFPYSPEALGLMNELGIDPPALEAKCTDRTVYKGLSGAYFFDKETFGADRLVTGTPGGPDATAKDWADFLAKTPLQPEAQNDIVRIQTEKTDYMSGMTQAVKKDKLSRMSYKDFLLNVVKAHPSAVALYQTRTHGLYGIGIDAVPALDCWAIHFPGFEGLGLDRVAAGGRLSFTAQGEVTPSPPYHFHYPDGNASIARMLVRSLVPSSAPGNTAEDIVTAKFDYSQLDKKDSPIRIRLNSTAVLVKHVGEAKSAKEVEVTYGREAKAYTVRARDVVLACWNMMIPYICPELPAEQKQALKYGVKVPLVYTVVAIKNWTSFHKLGISRVSTPGMYHSSVGLDQATNIGDYQSPKTPEEPVLVRMLRTPCQPGLPARDQQRAGHYDLLGTPFETFERNIRDQLARVLSEGGFDPARDIDAITVNRWPHGYAYEYNPLWDPDWPEGKRPCDIARRRAGRIAIANSDAAAAAYTDQAMDQGFRAVQELLSS